MQQHLGHEVVTASPVQHRAKTGDGVTYDPRSVKEILGEMKDTAELLIDLSDSSVLFEDDAVVAEVRELEDRRSSVRE